ncbi:hypothetical protein [Undibacterium terreum]|uniref:Uncharacterized protein n=1 Tax=Undibacterium terreum TaxID=1224302 RepID=A0A916UZQ2_9BURK|nr:hypothetical protein [Undibacterium terreum]GGC96113.1 hypothetical protein GCM10011396_49400 [Undibacterium terreum]
MNSTCAKYYSSLFSRGMRSLALRVLPVLLVLLATTLTACKTPPQVSEPAPVVAASLPAPAPLAVNETEDLLAYYQRTRLLPQTDLPRMLADLNVLARNPHRDVQRAIILGFMRGNGDLARAQAVLDGVVKSSDADAEHIKPLAYFLYTNYAEWRRLDEAADKQGQQLKDAQRRADQLSQKLEDLKAIERQLPARSKGAPTSPPSSPAPAGENKQ